MKAANKEAVAAVVVAAIVATSYFLAQIAVAGAATGWKDEDVYNRQAYGGWIDADGDCINTRHEVLAAESLIPPTIENCKVVRGLWFDLYTGLTFTDPRKLDVDHMVPLKEAHISGAYRWSDERKKEFSNDLDNPAHLIAVSASANRSKGSRDPSDWMPPNPNFHCAYITMWMSVKKRWYLHYDAREASSIHSVLSNCRTHKTGE